ncbi:hypothetical protein MIMGU_mgv1a026430mg [Erythranthe guttata]|uniref:Uncharacterized protein n=1 Tax=Erythranthe guttata TaxID=4155 RepID=A0A022Q9H7_ERYGU|nr:hypothetical protein MIMGU_mgv1a026430mg [Erythranthe guttata]
MADLESGQIIIVFIINYKGCWIYFFRCLLKAFKKEYFEIIGGGGLLTEEERGATTLKNPNSYLSPLHKRNS